MVRRLRSLTPAGFGGSLPCSHRAHGSLVAAGHLACVSCQAGTCHSGISIRDFLLLLAFGASTLISGSQQRQGHAGFSWSPGYLGLSVSCLPSLLFPLASLQT